MQRKIFASLCAAAMFAAPVQADAQTETTRSVRVDVRDTDARDPSAFNARLRRAAKDACGMHPGPMRSDEVRATRACVRAAMERRTG
jgi:UrcA family protein